MRPLTVADLRVGSSKTNASLVDYDGAAVLNQKVFAALRVFLGSTIAESLFSRAPAHPLTDGIDDRHGLLYVYDSRVPSYLDDMLLWKKTKMSVKQVVYTPESDSYKLKNHKTDTGEPVLRRQTWQGDEAHAEWRRHEYKLIRSVRHWVAGGISAVRACWLLTPFVFRRICWMELARPRPCHRPRPRPRLRRRRRRRAPMARTCRR